MKALRDCKWEDCEWEVIIMGTDFATWSAQTTDGENFIFVKKRESSEPFRTKEQAISNWKKFARLNNITKWEIV